MSVRHFDHLDVDGIENRFDLSLLKGWQWH
ncbi:MAG: hypothetical protein ACI9PP_002034, partial [Halobacteriales archaeon]